MNVTSQSEVEESTAVDDQVECYNRKEVQEEPDTVNPIEKISPPEILAEPVEKPEIPENL